MAERFAGDGRTGHGPAVYRFALLGRIFPPVKPEDQAREDIDRQLTACGWIVQDAKALNIHAPRRGRG